MSNCHPERVVVEDVRGERIRLLADGQDRRLGVSQKVMLDMALRESALRETVLDVQADLEILGKAATMGLVRHHIVSRFAQNMEAALRGEPETVNSVGGDAHA